MPVSNTNTSRTGFWPVGTISGASWHGGVRRYPVDGATNVCLGDPVELQANGTLKLLTANSDKFIGVVVGIEPVTKSTTSVQSTGQPNLEVKYIPKGTAGKVLIAASPETIFEATANFGATTANVGENANAVVGDNTSTFTGKFSNSVLNTKATAVTADGSFRIIDVLDISSDTNTALADGTNTKVLVVPMKHIFAKGFVAGI